MIQAASARHFCREHTVGVGAENSFRRLEQTTGYFRDYIAGRAGEARTELTFGFS